MNRRPLAPAGRIAMVLALAMSGLPAAAQPQRLDDAASPRPRVAAAVVLDEAGRPLEASPFAQRAQMRFGRVEYRLATAAYVGRQVRISYVVPALIQGLRSPQGLRVEWQGLAPLASGSARPGERVPVWSGQVTGPWTHFALDLTAHVDLRELALRNHQPFAFECYFDIEVVR